MRLLAYRLAAGLALITLLACSGLGVCWRQFARMQHHCCAGGDTGKTAQVKPCASLVAHKAVVDVAPPPVAIAPVTLDETFLAEVPVTAVPILPARAAPLVLRV